MAITVVQHTSTTKQVTSGTSTTATPTFSASTTSGNLLIATIMATSPNEPTISSVTTNGTAENWAVAASEVPNTGFRTYIYVNPNTGGGQTIIDVNVAFGTTLTTSNSGIVLVNIFEVSGLATSTPVDKTSIGAGTSTSWSSGATPTTTNATEFWIGVVSDFCQTANTTTTVTGPSSPWTNEAVITTSQQIGGTSTSDKYNIYQLVGHQITSSTGTATYSGTTTHSTDNWEALVVTLLPGSAAAGGVVVKPMIVNQAVTRAAFF